MYNLRLAEEADLEVVLEMSKRFHDSQMEPLMGIKFDVDSAASAALQIMSGDGLLILTEYIPDDAPETEPKVVGMIAGVYSRYRFNLTKLICKEEAFWLDEEHRGTGVAAFMLSTLATSAKMDDCTHVCMVSLDNSPAAASQLYRALHYTPVETAYIKPLEE